MSHSIEPRRRWRTSIIAISALVGLAAYGCGGSANGSEPRIRDNDAGKSTSWLPMIPAGPLAMAVANCSGDDLIDEYEKIAIIDLDADDRADVIGVVDDLVDAMWNVDEHTLTIDGAFAQDDDENLTTNGKVIGVVYTCVLDALDVPTRVRDHIASTRALDGQQTDSWGEVNARWTYHPNAGVSITLWQD